MRWTRTWTNKAIKGTAVVLGGILTWTGWTGPKLLDQVATVNVLDFVSSDFFRTVLVVVGLALIAFANLARLRFWESKSPRDGKKPKELEEQINGHIKQTAPASTQEASGEVTKPVILWTSGEEGRGPGVFDPAVTQEPFEWSNMYAADDIETYMHDSLRLSLTKMQELSRWRRGVICRVRTPSGTEHSSPVRLPDDNQEIRLFFPQDFGNDAPPVEDGTYRVIWDSFFSDDPEIASRDIAVRTVIITSHGKGLKIGQKWLMEDSEARQEVSAGHAAYLSDINGSAQ